MFVSSGLILSFFLSAAEMPPVGTLSTSSIMSGSLLTGASGNSLSSSTRGISEKQVPGSKILSTTYDIQKNSASEFVVQGITSLETVVQGLQGAKGKDVQKKENEVKKLVSGMLDLDVLGKRALITYWDELGKTVKGKGWREKYLGIFRQLVEENYMEKARVYVGGKYQIPLTGEETSGQGTTVKAFIKKTDVDLNVEFILSKTDKGWKIFDIRLDDTSLEGTYRSSFNRIIKKHGGLSAGMPELLNVMSKRLQELKKGKATTL